MKEVIVIVFLLLFYFFISYLAYIQLLKARTFLFVSISAAYFLFTYYFQFLIFRFYNYTIYHNINENSERINELISAVFFVCILTAFINIVAAIAGKEKRIKENPSNGNSQAHADKIHAPQMFSSVDR